jgi:hypothetical protein
LPKVPVPPVINRIRPANILEFILVRTWIIGVPRTDCPGQSPRHRSRPVPSQ